jgi:hypothetical protein
MLLPEADFPLKKNKEMLRLLPFLNERFASGKLPFFGLLDANLIFVLEVRKEGGLAELVHYRFAVGHLCCGSQNRTGI